MNFTRAVGSTVDDQLVRRGALEEEWGKREKEKVKNMKIEKRQLGKHMKKNYTSSFLWYTLVPCCFWAVAANVASFSLYRWAARLLYLAWASFVLQPCWRK